MWWVSCNVQNFAQFLFVFVFFVVVVVFLFDLGLTSLSTIFQSYRDGVCGRELKAHF